MSFNPRQFAARPGTLSEKLADVFDAVGITADGVGDSTDYYSAIRIGSITTPKTPSDQLTDLVGMQIYLKSNVEATSNDTSFIGAYIKVENITVDQPYKHMQALLVNTKLNYDVFDAYAVQAHITVATEMKTAGTNAHLTGLSGKAVLTSNATKGWVTAILGIIEGAGTVTEMCHVCSLVVEATCTASAVQSLLHLYSDKEIQSAIWMSGVANMLHLIHTDAATGCVVHGAGQPAGHESAGYFLIEVNGTDYAIPYWAIGDMANS